MINCVQIHNIVQWIAIEKELGVTQSHVYSTLLNLDWDVKTFDYLASVLNHIYHDTLHLDVTTITGHYDQLCKQIQKG